MMKLGIAGFGFVGQALYSCVKHKDSVCIYDKYKDKYKNNYNSLFDCKAIFVCLPSPTKDGIQDNREYLDFINSLITGRYKGLVIVKSTMLNIINEYQQEELSIVYNPEFLNQNTAKMDFYNQTHIILGGNTDDTYKAKDIYKLLFDFKYKIKYEHVTIQEAINLKYLHNIYNAYKSLFWNYVFDVTGNHRKIADLYTRISDRNEMDKVCSDGKRGFGGACFPKDLVAYHQDNEHDLTKFMIDLNTKYRPDEMEAVL